MGSETDVRFKQYVVRSIAAEALLVIRSLFVFQGAHDCYRNFEASKVTKKYLSAERLLLPHLGSALQIRQNHGCNTFALLRSLEAALQQKFANALSYALGHHCFCLISSGAFLLTG